MCAGCAWARQHASRALTAAFIKLLAGGQRAHLGIGHGTMQHPESAIRMDVVNAVGAERFDGALDALRDQIRRLDGIVLDIDDTDAEPTPAVEIAEGFQFVVAAAREFQHQVTGFELVEEGHEIPPQSLLHALAGVIPKAHMHGALTANSFQNLVDSRGSPILVFGMAADIGFIKLNDIGLNAL